MQDNNKPELKEGEELTVWGAVGPNGHVVKSSVGIFKAVANRWALRRGNYEVIALGKISVPSESDVKPRAAKPKRHREVRGPTSRKLRREPAQKNG
jgi:hypothetical protein